MKEEMGIYGLATPHVAKLLLLVGWFVPLALLTCTEGHSTIS